jgi:hypothetical protein
VVNSSLAASEKVPVSFVSSVDLPTDGNPINPTRASPRARYATMDDIEELRLPLSTDISRLRDDVKKQQEEIQGVQILVETQRRDHDKLKNECRRMDVRICDVQKDLEVSITASTNTIKALNTRIDTLVAGIHDVSDEVRKTQEDVKQVVETVRNELCMVKDIADEVSVGVDGKLQATLSKATGLYVTKEKELRDFSISFIEKMEKSYANHVAKLNGTTAAVKMNTEMKLAEFGERLNEDVVRSNNQTTRTVEWKVFKSQDTFIKYQEFRLYSAPFGAAEI